MLASHIEVPGLRTLSRHAGGHLVEATLIPLVLFYGGVTLFGTVTALVVALCWSYLAIARRLVVRRRVPGLLLLGAFGLTARTAVALATGSLFLYFLQPTLTKVAVAAIFLASIPAGSPMAGRLAADFCPLPDALLCDPPVRRFFNRLTVLWAGVQLASASIAVALLVSQPTATYLWTRSLASWVLTAGAIAVSAFWFKRSMRRHGLTVVHLG
jgi:Protein of unknown function (DUF3159)